MLILNQREFVRLIECLGLKLDDKQAEILFAHFDTSRKKKKKQN